MPLSEQSSSFSNPRRHFGALLVALTVLFGGTIVIDYTQRLLHARVVVGISILLLAQVLIVAVSQVHGRRGAQVTAFRLLIAATLAVQLATAFLDHPGVQLAAPIMAAVCVGYTIAVVLGHLIRARSADADTIYAAISVFLLMGVFWSVVYTAIARLEPGARCTFSAYLSSGEEGSARGRARPGREAVGGPRAR